MFTPISGVPLLLPAIAPKSSLRMSIWLFRSSSLMSPAPFVLISTWNTTGTTWVAPPVGSYSAATFVFELEQSPVVPSARGSGMSSEPQRMPCSSKKFDVT